MTNDEQNLLRYIMSCMDKITEFNEKKLSKLVEDAFINKDMSKIHNDFTMVNLINYQYLYWTGEFEDSFEGRKAIIKNTVNELIVKRKEQIKIDKKAKGANK